MARQAPGHLMRTALRHLAEATLPRVPNNTNLTLYALIVSPDKTSLVGPAVGVKDLEEWPAAGREAAARMLADPPPHSAGTAAVLAIVQDHWTLHCFWLRLRPRKPLG